MCHTRAMTDQPGGSDQDRAVGFNLIRFGSPLKRT